MSGFYLMHRGWQDNPVFGREDFSRRDAWVWLIEHAAFKPTQVGIGSKTIEVGRGQLCYSLRYMAKAWGWDDARVRRFLTAAVGRMMVTCVSDAGQTLITICNYEAYQTVKSVADAPTDAASTQHRRSIDANKNEGNTLVLSGKPTPIGVVKSKATRLPVGFVMPEEWIEKANTARVNAGLPTADLGTEGVKFVNYWTAKSGQAATKLDWLATWINWALNAKGNSNGRKTSGADGVVAGFAAALSRRTERDEDRRDNFDPPQSLRLV